MYRIVCEQALQLWRAKRALRERASERRSPVSLTRVSFRVRVSRDFSRLPQTESLLAGYLLHEKLFSL